MNENSSFLLCFKRERFAAITNTLIFQNQQLTVIFEGRRSHCQILNSRDIWIGPALKVLAGQRGANRRRNTMNKQVVKERGGLRFLKGGTKFPLPKPRDTGKEETSRGGKRGQKVPSSMAISEEEKETQNGEG